MQRLIDANVINFENSEFDTYSDYRRAFDAIYFAPPVLTIPDNPTNGDMIKALFPNKQFVSICSTRIYDFTTDNKIDCDLDWWDSPYKGSEHENTE